MSPAIEISNKQMYTMGIMAGGERLNSVSQETRKKLQLSDMPNGVLVTAFQIGEGSFLHGTRKGTQFGESALMEELTRRLDIPVGEPGALSDHQIAVAGSEASMRANPDIHGFLSKPQPANAPDLIAFSSLCRITLDRRNATRSIAA